MIKKLLLISACMVSMPTFTLAFAPRKQKTEDLSIKKLSLIKKNVVKKIARYIGSIVVQYNQSNGK